MAKAAQYPSLPPASSLQQGQVVLPPLLPARPPPPCCKRLLTACDGPFQAWPCPQSCGWPAGKTQSAYKIILCNKVRARPPAAPLANANVKEYISRSSAGTAA